MISRDHLMVGALVLLGTTGVYSSPNNKTRQRWLKSGIAFRWRKRRKVSDL